MTRMPRRNRSAGFDSDTEALIVEARMAAVRRQAGNVVQELEPASETTANPSCNIVRAVQNPNARARETLVSGVGSAVLGHIQETYAQVRIRPADKLYLPLLSSSAAEAIAREAKLHSVSTASLMRNIVSEAVSNTPLTIHATVEDGLKTRGRDNAECTIGLPLISSAVASDTRLIAQIGKEMAGKNVNYHGPTRYLPIATSSEPWIPSVQQNIRDLYLPDWKIHSSVTLGILQVVDMNNYAS